MPLKYRWPPLGSSVLTVISLPTSLSASTEEAWGVPGPKAPPPPDRTVPDQLSEWSLEHRWNVDDVQQDMIKAFKKKYNMD